MVFTTMLRSSGVEFGLYIPVPIVIFILAVAERLEPITFLLGTLTVKVARQSSSGDFQL